MKIEENNRFVTTVGNFIKSEFVVESKNMRHLMSILRDQLYSDKQLAPIREYSCNAYDANVENQKSNVPIKVTLPTVFFPEFKVRDYGKGLTLGEMQNIFCSYGESTKRNSNDYIGQLGIGSKSGFAYGDNFLVTSFNNGKKSIYNCVLDQLGTGSLILLLQEDSNDENGIEITIPVKKLDVVSFRNKAIKFYKYWKVLPEFIGEISDSEKKELNLKINSVFKGESWQIYNEYDYNNKKSHIIMGNISYPLNWELVYDTSNDNFNNNVYIEFLKANNILINIPIGGVDISPSRESLQYTDKTIKVLQSKVSEIISSLETIIIDRIKNSPNLFEAKLNYGILFGHINSTDRSVNDYNLRHIYAKLENVFKIHKPLKWNDIKITSSSIEVHLPELCAIHGKRMNYTEVKIPLVHMFYINMSGRIRHEILKRNYDRIECRPNEKFIINDTFDPKIKKTAIKFYLEKHNITKAYFLDFLSKEAKDSFYKETHFESIPVIKITDILNEYKLNKPKKVHTKIDKSLAKVGAINLSDYIKLYNFEKKYEIVELSKVNNNYYIYVENNEVLLNNNITTKIHTALGSLYSINKLLKLNLDKLYIVGPMIKNKKGFDNNKWINVIEFINNKIKSNNDLNEWISLSAYTKSINHTENKQDPNMLIIPHGPVNRILNTKLIDNKSKFVQLTSKINLLKINEDVTLINEFIKLSFLEQNDYNKIINTKIEEYKTIWKSLYDEYKHLKYMPIQSIPSSGSSLKDIIDYINLVDNNIKKID